MKHKALAICACLVLLFTACSGTSNTANFTLYGMRCASCERNVREIVEGLGATVTSISAQQDNLAIEFDTNTITLAEIESALTQGGYTIGN